MTQVTFLKDDFYNQVVVEKDILHPVGIDFDKNGRGYIWLKRGVVMLLDTNGVLIKEPLINISEEVVGNGDHGLLGFALDPDFLENGYFYLFYVVDRHHLMNFGKPTYDATKTIEKEATISRITRFQADQATNFKTILPNSRKVLVGETISDRSFPILMSSHGVGTLAFGEDGTLLASCGDAAGFQKPDVGSAEETYFAQALADGIIQEKENVGSFKAQLIDNLSGKIIRINPATGEGVPSNPYYDAANPSAPRSRVWAMGLRNPYRFVYLPGSGAHDPLAGNPGTFIIGDVGAGSYEEIDVLDQGGTNFGWPLYEGYQYAWQYWNQKTENKDAPNPLAVEQGCNRPFFYFDELFQEENKDQQYEFWNPCDSIFIAETTPTYIHKRPTLAFSNASWNPPTTALMGGFDARGNAITQSVEEKEQVIAANFDGYSVFPGFFYESGNFPADYTNKLFVGDFSGWIKTFSFDEANNIIEIEDFMQREKGLVGLKLNPKDDCLYYIHFSTHSLHKICYGGNPPPVAKIEVDKNYGSSPLEIQFNANQSKDPFGEKLTYFWDFGDGNTSDVINPKFTFITQGDQPTTQKVRLVVTDEIGNEAETEQVISINNTPPMVEITSFSDGQKYPVSTYNFLPLAAKVSDQEHDDADLNYTWQVFLHHNAHDHPEPEIHEKTGQTLISPLGCEEANYWYRIRLKVTDGAGLESFDEKQVYPYCGTPIIADFQLTAKANDEGNQLNWDFIQHADNLENLELYRGESYSNMQLLADKLPVNTKDFLDITPINGINYYQLKITSQDGLYDFSNLISVEFPPDPLLQVYPNPLNGTAFQLGLREAFSNKIYLKIYNGLGQQIFDIQLDAVENAAFLQRINLPNLINGLYFYEVQNGSLNYGGKLIIGQ